VRWSDPSSHGRGDGDGDPAAVADCWSEPLEDDATVVVLKVD
jgi:hypothetical protein